ncbi:hypothetical protein UFOVP238_26 [uncultured Caudovirales phage]|uniref:Uncharacterized protein n=1 Tax=uncultured Caudovirales phage TaxID=2100421 RepID=A0A6J7WRH6_9CAUD|nr:hypothetical protein UFOVP238_26 [uncultured Caudovirales phage]
MSINQDTEHSTRLFDKLIRLITFKPNGKDMMDLTVAGLSVVVAIGFRHWSMGLFTMYTYFMGRWASYLKD